MFRSFNSELPQNDYYLFQTTRAHHQELIAEATRERMLRDADLRHTAPSAKPHRVFQVARAVASAPFAIVLFIARAIAYRHSL